MFERALFDSPQQYPRQMAKGTVELLVKNLQGEEVPRRTLIPCAQYREQSVDDESRIKEQW